MLDWILIVTIATSNLAVAESAYREDLGYEAVARGKLEAALAESWGAPRSAGSRYLLMRPASGMPVYLRFIESTSAGENMPHATEGWNAAEMLVADPDELAERLADSKHFQIVGPPAYLTLEQNIRAMQVIGPSNEMLYLTRVVRPENVEFDIGTAESFVDRVFIVIAGGRDHRTLMNFYRDRLMLPVTEPMLYRIAVLSRAYGLPEDQLHPLSLATLRNQFFLELDEYPAESQPRRIPPGELPGGIAMVTFEVESLENISVPFISPPTVRDLMPYNGRRTATLRGAVGELIELVESRSKRNVADPHVPN
ncbi:MAG: hypothetical protein ACREUU_18275 [Gammaproteobacteria bacterium]